MGVRLSSRRLEHISGVIYVKVEGSHEQPRVVVRLFDSAKPVESGSVGIQGIMNVNSGILWEKLKRSSVRAGMAQEPEVGTNWIVEYLQLLMCSD